MANENIKIKEISIERISAKSLHDKDTIVIDLNGENLELINYYTMTKILQDKAKIAKQDIAALYHLGNLFHWYLRLTEQAKRMYYDQLHNKVFVARNTIVITMKHLEKLKTAATLNWVPPTFSAGDVQKIIQTIANPSTEIEIMKVRDSKWQLNFQPENVSTLPHYINLSFSNTNRHMMLLQISGRETPCLYCGDVEHMACMCPTTETGITTPKFFNLPSMELSCSHEDQAGTNERDGQKKSTEKKNVQSSKRNSVASQRGSTLNNPTEVSEEEIDIFSKYSQKRGGRQTRDGSEKAFTSKRNSIQPQTPESSGLMSLATFIMKHEPNKVKKLHRTKKMKSIKQDEAPVIETTQTHMFGTHSSASEANELRRLPSAFEEPKSPNLDKENSTTVAIKFKQEAAPTKVLSTFKRISKNRQNSISPHSSESEELKTLASIIAQREACELQLKDSIVSKIEKQKYGSKSHLAAIGRRNSSKSTPSEPEGLEFLITPKPKAQYSWASEHSGDEDYPYINDKKFAHIKRSVTYLKSAHPHRRFYAATPEPGQEKQLVSPNKEDPAIIDQSDLVSDLNFSWRNDPRETNCNIQHQQTPGDDQRQPEIHLKTFESSTRKLAMPKYYLPSKK